MTFSDEIVCFLRKDEDHGTALIVFQGGQAIFSVDTFGVIHSPGSFYHFFTFDWYATNRCFARLR